MMPASRGGSLGHLKKQEKEAVGCARERRQEKFREKNEKDAKKNKTSRLCSFSLPLFHLDHCSLSFSLSLSLSLTVRF
jgi:hypothetical protein